MDEARQAAVAALIAEIRDTQARIEHMAVDEKAPAAKKRMHYASIDLETAVEHLRRALGE